MKGHRETVQRSDAVPPPSAHGVGLVGNGGWPDETLNLLPEVLLRFGVPAQRRKAAKAQRKDIYVVMMGLKMTGKSATGKCSCHPSSCQPLATNPSTIPRRITNPSYSHRLNPFRPVRSGVHDDLRNLALGPIRLFCFLFCAFAASRLCVNPLPENLATAHSPVAWWFAIGRNLVAFGTPPIGNITSPSHQTGCQIPHKGCATDCNEPINTTLPKLLCLHHATRMPLRFSLNSPTGQTGHRDCKAAETGVQ